MSRSILNSFTRKTLATATAAALTALAAPTFAANLWQPLCPDRTLCATTTDAFVANGRVLMSSSNPASIPSQWVTIDSLQGMPTQMHDVSVATSGAVSLWGQGATSGACRRSQSRTPPLGPLASSQPPAVPTVLNVGGNGRPQYAFPAVIRSVAPHRLRTSSRADQVAGAPVGERTNGIVL